MAGIMPNGVLRDLIEIAAPLDGAPDHVVRQNASMLRDKTEQRISIFLSDSKAARGNHSKRRDRLVQFLKNGLTTDAQMPGSRKVVFVCALDLLIAEDATDANQGA
jgi:hypothetical protein